MPLGLKTAPGSFQTQQVLTRYLNKFALVYLDDIIIYSNSWDDHLLRCAKSLNAYNNTDYDAPLSNVYLPNDNYAT